MDNQTSVARSGVANVESLSSPSHPSTELPPAVTYNNNPLLSSPTLSSPTRHNPQNSPSMNPPGSSPRLGSPPPPSRLRPGTFPPPSGTETTGPRSLSLSPTHLTERRPPISPSSLLVSGPNMPFSASQSESLPVRFSEHQKAMEHAIAVERKRAKEMEENETNLSADELRSILKQERHRMAGFARTIADLRLTAVQCQSQAEIHEEGRINSLLSRLETMQMEKGRIVNELEREEEMLTNTLQRKLDLVRREKEQLEKVIEREQMSHSILQSQVTGLRQGSDSSSNIVNNSTTTVMSALDSLTEGEDEEEEDGDLDAVLPDLATANADI